MPNELKPCPFCGGKATIFYTMDVGIPTGDNGFRVTARCDNMLHCGAEIRKWAAKKEWAKSPQ
ncbi:MAG: Lar family restriction alleviation protein [Clostridia bacterium]|nr:Lar family restriction alleviation protein [Clostridia bacterium]